MLPDVNDPNMIVPDPLAFEVQGIRTRPHDERTKGYSYLVYVHSHRHWRPVRDALRNGMVSYPPPLPGRAPQAPTEVPHRAASDASAQQLRNESKQP